VGNLGVFAPGGADGGQVVRQGPFLTGFLFLELASARVGRLFDLLELAEAFQHGCVGVGDGGRAGLSFGREIDKPGARRVGELGIGAQQDGIAAGLDAFLQHGGVDVGHGGLRRRQALGGERGGPLQLRELHVAGAGESLERLQRPAGAHASAGAAPAPSSTISTPMEAARAW